MNDEPENIVKSEFLTNILNEIRFPINKILGFFDLLQRTDLTKEQKEYLDEAIAASDTLLYMINDIIDFSKIEAGRVLIEKINFKIRTTIEDVVSSFETKAHEKNIELKTIIDSNVPEELIGDPARIRQIISNIVGNAVKFTVKGEIVINVYCSDISDKAATITFEVKDTGIGISEDALCKMRELFLRDDIAITERIGETGLGIAISKELVRLLNGDISVESEFGVGSVFKFSVKMEFPKKVISVNAIENFKKINVLVVDENEITRNLIAGCLEETGCKVYKAESADKAITTILLNVNTENEIGLAIVDYQLPGMNGFQLADALKQIPTANDVKLVLLTSAAQKGDSKTAKEYGFSGYLSKPFRKEELLYCIALVLGAKMEEEQPDQVVTKYTVKELFQ